jgi:hypothetical protein
MGVLKRGRKVRTSIVPSRESASYKTKFASMSLLAPRSIPMLCCRTRDSPQTTHTELSIMPGFIFGASPVFGFIRRPACDLCLA